MKRCYSFILGLTLLLSCTSNTIYKKPDDLIPRDTMVSVLAEMFIAQTARSVRNLNFEKEINYHAILYKKYNIDSARFNRSNFYYTSILEDYEKMLNDVQRKVEEKQKEVAAAKKVFDSIKRDSLLKIKRNLSRPKENKPKSLNKN